MSISVSFSLYISPCKIFQFRFLVNSQFQEVFTHVIPYGNAYFKSNTHPKFFEVQLNNTVETFQKHEFPIEKMRFYY